MTEKLNHDRPYYKGLGNTSYSECLDCISRRKKSIVRILAMFALFAFICWMLFQTHYLNAVNFCLSFGIVFGYTLLGVILLADELGKFKLRMKEIEGGEQ